MSVWLHVPAFVFLYVCALVCLNVYVSACLRVCMSGCLQFRYLCVDVSACLCVRVLACLRMRAFLYLCACASTCVYVRVSMYMRVCLRACVCVRVSVCLCVGLSVCTSLFVVCSGIPPSGPGRWGEGFGRFDCQDGLIVYEQFSIVADHPRFYRLCLSNSSSSANPLRADPGPWPHGAARRGPCCGLMCGSRDSVDAG